MHLIATLTIYLFFQTNAADTAIVFREINYSEIFDLAKKEDKPIFLYFHFIGCSGCLKMEQTVFTNKKVYDFINQNFICYSVNIAKPEGSEIRKKYDISGFPIFLFLDFNGNIIHKITGPRSPEEFLQECQNVK